MISRINNSSLIFLSLALGLGSCRNKNNLKETGENRVISTTTADEKAEDKNTVAYTFEYDNTEKALHQDKNNYNVRGKDEDGNEVFGSIYIEGEVGIGIISGVEENAIEIVAERSGQNSLIATDVKGYEYKLKVDRN